jgi:leucyl aminopeptidase (aminopeptidase T)
MKIKQVLKEIFTTNLGVTQTERVLVFTDKYSNKGEDERRDSLIEIAHLATEIGRELVGSLEYCEYLEVGTHGAEPPVELWIKAFGQGIVDRLKKDGLLDKIIEKRADAKTLIIAEEIIASHHKEAVDAVIALSNYSTSHTRFRDFLTRICGTRYASMPLFDKNMLDGAMSVDWLELERKSNIIAEAVNKAITVKIKTPNGTDMTISKKDRFAHADTGNLRTKGTFGNLPAGEVYFAPMEGESFGVMVLDWAPTRKLLSPVKLEIQDGRVVRVEGQEEYVGILNKKLSERAENSNIAELGIGTNELAKHPENILEAEKIAGTIHIALGDNSSFGGVVKTPFHQDFIFFEPTVVLIDIDGRQTTLINNGIF